MKTPLTITGTAQISRSTITRVDQRLLLQAIRITPKRQKIVNQPLKSNFTRSISKALVWAVIQ